MNLSIYCLTLGGMASLFVAVLHVILAIKPQGYRTFGGGELAELAKRGSPFVVLVTVGLALMFAIWGAYGFSGAGMIGPLPLLQAVLIAIGVLYMLGSAMLASEFVKSLGSGSALRFAAFSAGALTFGLLHLVGALTR
jgi:hypothetical protein